MPRLPSAKEQRWQRRLIVLDEIRKEQPLLFVELDKEKEKKEKEEKEEKGEKRRKKEEKGGKGRGGGRRPSDT